MKYEEAFKELLRTIHEYQNDRIMNASYCLRKIVAKARAMELRIEYDGEEQHEVVDR